MKTQIESGQGTSGAVDGIKTARFQIYRQTRAGSYVAGFKSDSAWEAIEAFLSTTPLFDGGELRIWDSRERGIAAVALWHPERTDFGFTVHHRTNVFHNHLFGLVARHIQDREAIRSEIQRNVEATV